MFQDYVLFPQRDVHGNVAFGLQMRGLTRRRRSDARVAEVLELVGLPGYDAALSRRSCRAASSSASPWLARWRQPRAC